MTLRRQLFCRQAARHRPPDRRLAWPYPGDSLPPAV